MEIKSLQDLKAVIALCRKAGVASIELGGLKLLLGEKPPTRSQSRTAKYTEESTEHFQTPTEEQLLMWSVRDGDLNKEDAA
jgi:hypothetical protein